MERPAKDDACHHCKEVGHCKRNCPAYLVELIKKKKQVGTASSSDVFTIELFSFPNKSLVNGIYEIDMHDLMPNVNSIYNVSNKRVKHNLDSTYLWHFHLAYINKKRIKQLQQDGLLKSTDDESFDKCESCLSGKMTKKPFPHSNERAKDLLGIIHTDVCGPLRHVSRQGASYFITFTDDYSRYGYVYLLKHKHEVFETFKVFKNEVENQLGKTIKAIRSDRGGEYISQEFKDNLKANGIGCETLVKRDTSDKLEQRSVKCIFIGYLKETMGYYFYFLPENKIVVATYAEFFEKRLINQEISERAVEGFEPPQPPLEEDILIPRSERTRRVPNRLCLNVEVEEPSLGDLNKPTSYKAAMLDSKSNKWIDAMNAEIQSMIDNKDLGEATFILGIKIYKDRSKQLIRLSQNAYMDKVLMRYKMDNSKCGTIPMQERLDLNKSQGAQTPKEDAFCFEQKRTEMEVVWNKKFISGLGIVPTINEPIKMFCDNSVTLLIANEPGVQMGARYYHRSNLLKVHTDNNLADPFTKALSNRKLTQHARSMGLRPARSFM
ncbi:retrotransposon protein, putative, ty1-copia subclass [Tanacetum coccineum]